jgi:hypothetical protein
MHASARDRPRPRREPDAARAETARCGAPRALSPALLVALQRSAGNRATAAVVARVKTDKKTARVLIERVDVERVIDRAPSAQQSKPPIRKVKGIVKALAKPSDPFGIEQLRSLVPPCVTGLEQSQPWAAELADLLLLGLELSDPSAQLVQQKLKLQLSPQATPKSELEAEHGPERVRLTTFTSADGTSRPILAVINAINAAPTPDDAIRYLESSFGKDDLPRLLATTSVHAALVERFESFRVSKTIPPDVLDAVRQIVNEYGKTAVEETAQVARLKFEAYLDELASKRPQVHAALMNLTTKGAAPVAFATLVADVRAGKDCNQELAGFLRNALGNALQEKPDTKPWYEWLKKATKSQKSRIELAGEYWTPLASAR